MKYRPSNMALRDAVPFVSIGGAEGSICIFMVYVQFPASDPSSLWFSPGLPISIICAISCCISAMLGRPGAVDVEEVPEVAGVPVGCSSFWLGGFDVAGLAFGSAFCANAAA